MAPKILFVCLGNICRSAAAEGVLRAIAPELVVDSAGTGGWHVGEPPYAPMQRAAARRGFDLSGQQARQFVAGDFRRFDLILAMDKTNLRDIERLRPAESVTPVRLLTDFAPETGATHIPDPYYSRDFKAALDLIEISVRRLVQAF